MAADLEKIARGKKLSPVLLVRGDLATGLRLQIADGYHRVCASYHTDENTDIPCRLSAQPTASQAAPSTDRGAGAAPAPEPPPR